MKSAATSPLAQRIAVATALAMIAFVPYIQTLRFGFVNYDDMTYAYENEVVLRGITWQGLHYALTSVDGGNWHPLTWISHMTDAQLWNQWAGGHHLTSALLHAINSALLFAALLALFGVGTLWRCAFVAALFAAHPMHVESVAWVSERKDVLSTCFGLLALWLYAGYARQPTLATWGLVAATWILSLMSKPMLVTFPFLLLLLDVWPLQRWRAAGIGGGLTAGGSRSESTSRILAEKAPLFAVTVVFCMISVMAQKASSTTVGLELLPLTARAANAVVAYKDYIVRTIVTRDLAVFYPHPVNWSVVSVAGSATVVAVVSIVSFAVRRTMPWVLIGWLWFLGLLVPVIGIVQVGYQHMADRYSYVPSVGLFIMAAWSIPRVSGAIGTVVTGVCCVVVIVSLSLGSFAQAAYWRDGRSLFSHAIDVTSDNYVAHHNLADLLQDEGDVEGALEHYRKSLSIRPKNPTGWQNVGALLVRLGRYEDAIEPLMVAYELDRTSAETCNSLGVALLSRGKAPDAVTWLERAVTLDPDHLDARGNYGAALLNIMRPADAIPHLEYVVTRRPDRLGVRTNLARALAAAGRIADARTELTSILATRPDYLPAHALLNQMDTDSTEGVDSPSP